MLIGLAVSLVNGTVPWPDLSADELAFAIARSSEGPDRTDPTFERNWHGIQERGLVAGAYHTATPHVSGPATAEAVSAAATAEAQNMLAVLDGVGGIRAGDLPPALALEVSSGLTEAQVYAWTETWVHVVESDTGRKPMIYTGPFWRWTLNAFTDAWGCPLWLAQYAGTRQVPRAWDTWTLWEYTDMARVDGIAGDVCLSCFNGSHSELERLAGSPPSDQPSRSP